MIVKFRGPKLNLIQTKALKCGKKLKIQSKLKFINGKY
jgi:hypothetical protein